MVFPDEGGKKAMYLGLFSQELKSWTKLNYSLPAKWGIPKMSSFDLPLSMNLKLFRRSKSSGAL